MFDILKEILTGAPCGCHDHACPASTGERPWWKNPFTWITGVGLGLFTAAVIARSPGLYGAAVLVAGLPVGGAAVRSVIARKLDMNVLMVLAVSGAIFLGEWFEAALVVLLFSLSESLERFNLDRSRRSIRKLMDLAPPTATVRMPYGEVRCPVENVDVGSVMLVRPGERIALDGRILSGASHLNQAPITGESMPVSRAPGDEVFAGSINGEGFLEVEVTRGHQHSTLARIVHLVEAAEAGRAPVEKMVDRFAAIYTPVVVVVAAAMALLGPVIWEGSRGDWLYRSMALLLIACPCALVISTPVSVLSSLSRAARAGILVKGGIHLERAGRVSTVLFDKTGTLTRGQPRVVAVIPAPGVSEAQLLGLAATAEYGSEHPLARAVMEAAQDQGIVAGNPHSLTSVPGRGVRAIIDGQEVVVGSPVWMSEITGDPAVRDLEAAASVDGREGGHTFLMVARDGSMMGALAVSDTLRPEAARAVSALRQIGITELVMLTGDNSGAASLISSQAGLSSYRAGLLPEDKVEAVIQFRQLGLVAMVGDGINDAPALAAADLGLALGVAGSDAALETADIALMADDLLKLPFLIRLSRATRSVITQNVALAVGIKALALLLAASGHFTLWMAVLADTGAALLVVSNGMRLLGFDRAEKASSVQS